MKQWRAIPESRWTSYEEPDETKDRPPRVIEIANTTTRIGPDRTPVRTVVAREYHGRKKKECYHVLYTNVARERGYSLVNEFRQRQRHEEATRVGVYVSTSTSTPSRTATRRIRPPRPRPSTRRGWASWPGSRRSPSMR